MNPATAVGMMYYINKLKAKGFGQTGSSSCVGKELLLLNHLKYKLKTVNVHRSESYEEGLNALGSSKNLNQFSQSFLVDLKEALKTNEVTAFFDCVGGEVAQNIFEVLPKDATLFIYGVLSLKLELNINISNLIFNSRNLRGFHLMNDFLSHQKLSDYIEDMQLIVQNFHNLGF